MASVYSVILMQCKSDGTISNVLCCNTLPSGVLWHYSLCNDYWDKSEANQRLLPEDACYYCYDCILNLQCVTSCKSHRYLHDTTCDNILPSGTQCTQLLCKFCMNVSVVSADLLPSSVSLLCED